MPAPTRLVVGRVLRPHGVRGEVLVEVLSDAPERFSPGQAVAAGDPESGGPLRPLEVASARVHQGRMLVRFAGVGDRDEAQALRGNLLSIPIQAARELDENEFWRHQLVGLAVVDAEGEHRGEVADVLPGAAHDLFQVRRPDGVEVLVPAAAALVRVELDAGRIVVQDIPGLLDPDGSR